MIYTVTFNPAIDYVVRLDRELQVGDVNRARGEDCVLGGKGINVSGVLAQLGCESVALGFVAGETGAWLERGLAAQGLKTDFVHLDHGMKNIQWNRDTKWVYDNIVGQTRTMEKTENCEVERTGLHSREFIDTIRYTLSGPHTVSMDDTVHVMNLVEGRSARIESMGGSFAAFTVHYAETAIVPAAVGTYRIVPEEGEMIKMLVASVG